MNAVPSNRSMKNRTRSSVLSAGVLCCVLALFLAGCGRNRGTVGHDNAEGLAPTPAEKPIFLAVPKYGAYTGAYIDFGETEDNVTLEGIENFEGQTGKHQAIVAFSSFWGQNMFPTEAIDVITEHHSVPLIFWSPWDRPYREDLVQASGPDKFRLENILNGLCDEYIDQWAAGAAAYGKPMLVSLCNEMNGDWFPWSGAYYGGGQPIAGTNPALYVGPEYFKRAYRYIVDRVRAHGGWNVLWVFHVNNYSEPVENWTSFEQYYPGSGYVDWLGLSVYGQQFPDGKWDLFNDMMKTPYDELCKLDATKPVMVTEWGVGEFPASGDKGEWITDAFSDMEKEFPRVRAAVYWHERWQNTKTLFYSNLKVTSSPKALEAYRRGVASSYWLPEPIFR